MSLHQGELKKSKRTGKTVRLSNHCQLFFKKLRLANSEKIKYYLVGEYGGIKKRPHYHVLLFNANIETIQPAWSYGEVWYGTVTEASIGYCFKYIMKPSRVPEHRNDDRIPEFALMSKDWAAVT